MCGDYATQIVLIFQRNAMSCGPPDTPKKADPSGMPDVAENVCWLLLDNSFRRDADDVLPSYLNCLPGQQLPELMAHQEERTGAPGDSTAARRTPDYPACGFTVALPRRPGRSENRIEPSHGGPWRAHPSATWHVLRNSRRSALRQRFSTNALPTLRSSPNPSAD